MCSLDQSEAIAGLCMQPLCAVNCRVRILRDLAVSAGMGKISLSHRHDTYSYPGRRSTVIPFPVGGSNLQRRRTPCAMWPPIGQDGKPGELLCAKSPHKVRRGKMGTLYCRPLQ